MMTLHAGPCPGYPRCPFCVNLVNNPEARRKHGVPDSAIAPYLAQRNGTARTPLHIAGPACAFWGKSVGTVPCRNCGGGLRSSPVHACAIHGRATIKQSEGASIKACMLCTDGVARNGEVPREAKVRINALPATYKPGRITTRNLLYHIYPVAANGVWQWNVQQLLQRISLFNGKRVVAIVTDRRTDSADEVKRAFGKEVSDFIVMPNDRKLREVVTFEKLYGSVETNDPSEATFWSHAKGVTSSSWTGDAVKHWAKATYELCLDYWPAVERLLKQFPVVGPFKRPMAPWKESTSDWHYSGSSHWFHNASLFAKDWKRIDQFYGGIEAYPSLHFTKEEAGSLFFEFVRVGENTLYTAVNWDKEILAELDKWRGEHRDDYAPPKITVDKDAALIDDFHRLYYDRGYKRQGTWTNTFWRGVRIEKCPLDLHVLQEIIHEVRPELIIETGTAHGGSALFLADMCELNGVGHIVTIDPSPREPLPLHKRITYLRGSSTDPAIINKVSAMASGIRTMVILDSDHSKAHVSKELWDYASMVTCGSYVIVEDTNIGGHPVLPKFGPGPWDAVVEFLRIRPEFVVDTDREKLMVTFHPRGWLKRIA